MKTQKIIPNLWFDSEKFKAEDASEFYKPVFKNVEIESISRYGKSGEEIHGQKPGSVMTVNFSIENHEFVGLNGGPHFQINPSVSFFVICKTEDEINNLWKKLKNGGEILMPLDKYEWSAKYAWFQDKFGLNWQLMLEEPPTTQQKIVPCFFFTGKSHGKAEEVSEFMKKYNWEFGE